MQQLPECDEFELAIVEQWSEIHKRSALVHLIMVGLDEGPKWSADLLAFIEDVTGGAWGVDDRSLYRALRRLEKAQLVRHAKQATAGTGAKRKVFELTGSGQRVLARYEAQTLAYQARIAATRAGPNS